MTISDSGQWDDVNRKVKWGPLFDSLSRALTIELQRVASSNDRPPSLGGGKDPVNFSGTVSFDGVNRPVAVR